MCLFSLSGVEKSFCSIWLRAPMMAVDTKIRSRTLLGKTSPETTCTVEPGMRRRRQDAYRLEYNVFNKHTRMPFYNRDAADEHALFY